MAMNRTEYLQRCQFCARIPNKVFTHKENLPADAVVVFEGRRYYPLGYELTFAPTGETRHTAILHDIKGNSVTKVPLSAVEMIEEERK